MNRRRLLDFDQEYLAAHAKSRRTQRDFLALQIICGRLGDRPLRRSMCIPILNRRPKQLTVPRRCYRRSTKVGMAVHGFDPWNYSVQGFESSQALMDRNVGLG